jgi:hypothetical protein
MGGRYDAVQKGGQHPAALFLYKRNIHLSGLLMASKT